jgi:hypothetical protein
LHNGTSVVERGTYNKDDANPEKITYHSVGGKVKSLYYGKQSNDTGSYGYEDFYAEDGVTNLGNYREHDHPGSRLAPVDQKAVAWASDSIRYYCEFERKEERADDDDWSNGQDFLPDDNYIYYYPYNESYTGGQYFLVSTQKYQYRTTSEYVHITKTDEEIYKHRVPEDYRGELLEFHHFGSDPVHYKVDDIVYVDIGGNPVKEEGTVQCFFPPAEEQGKSYLDPDAQMFRPQGRDSDSWRRQVLEKGSEDTLPVREHAPRRRRLVELLRSVMLLGV